MKRLCLLVLFVIFSAGCNPSAQEICNDRLPELQRSVSNAITILRDWHDDNAGRSLASLGEKGEAAPYTGLAEPDRRSWQKWAERHLVETQQYIDRVPLDPRFRKARDSLTEMANAFVSFHGYAASSKTGPMIRSLESIYSRGERIETEVCRGMRPQSGP